MENLHEIEVTTIDGQPEKLSRFAGQTLLIVNVASKCGLTPHYKGLQALQEKYADKAFTVLGFPCNQFMGQEPGSEADIKQFCSTEYGVTFPMFSKLEVNGPGRHPLYTLLTTTDTTPAGPGDIQWNFEKFVVDGSGKITARFAPPTEPEAPELIAAIEKNLG